MKKLNVLIVILLTLLISPNIVNAAQVSVSCSNVIVGNETECVIRGTATALSDIDAKISVTGGVTMTSITNGEGFTPMENIASGKSGSFAYITSYDKQGSFIIAKVRVRADSVGTATFTISSPIVTDNGQNVTLSSASSTFMVNEQPTSPTQPTQTPTSPTSPTQPTKTPTSPTSPTTVGTKKPINITSPTQSSIERPDITSPILESLKLLSITVDNFPVVYQDGAYYVNTENFTESVTISATAEEGVSIIGTGVRNLTFGKNVVEIILKNAFGQSNTYQVIITRPDDLNVHDTKLTNLKVVDYGFAFDPNTTEYTIKVPYNIEEIYVIAETLNSDVNISGAGLKTLTKGENKIYIKVSYGESQSTDYVITVKRSYSLMILLVGSGLLGTGLIAALIYAYINRKAAMEARVANKNRIIAEGVRQEIQSNTPNLSVNGQNVIGEGRRTVVPTKVVSVKTSNQPVQSAVSPKVVNNNTNLADNAPSAQIKLVKKIPLDQIPTPQAIINNTEKKNNNI